MAFKKWSKNPKFIIQEKGCGPHLTQNESLYEQRKESFEHTKARLLKIINEKPGLTTEQLSTVFLNNYNYLPTIDNRLRDLRKEKKVSSLSVNEKLHWYPIPFEGIMYSDAGGI